MARLSPEDSLVRFEIRSRSGKCLADLQLHRQQTVADLKTAFFKSNPKYAIHRQYFTSGLGQGRTAVKGDTTKLSTLDIDGDNIVLYFKDLGPQVSWRTVFFVEYGGPIFIHLLVYFFPQLFYSKKVTSRSLPQMLAICLVVVHYVKRELETAFVHRFSNGYMPLRNIFKNSFHYWFLGGLNVAYFVYHPDYTQLVADQVAITCAIVFVLAMFSNLYCHILLMKLRPAGSTVRKIPKGFAFEFVSCPNYLFEIIAWCAFAVMTSTITSGLFAIVSAAQMYVWAINKHASYRKEFPAYPKQRKALIPFVV